MEVISQVVVTDIASVGLDCVVLVTYAKQLPLSYHHAFTHIYELYPYSMYDVLYLLFAFFSTFTSRFSNEKTSCLVFILSKQEHTNNIIFHYRQTGNRNVIICSIIVIQILLLTSGLLTWVMNLFIQRPMFRKICFCRIIFCGGEGNGLGEIVSVD